MSSLRKTVGQRIKAARRAAGYKSARAFAGAIGVSESSVANAEIGSARVGEGVLMDIESGLGWPPGSINEALSSGKLGFLQVQRNEQQELYRRVVNRNDEFELQVMELDDLPIEARWDAIFAHRARRAARQSDEQEAR